MKTNRFVSYTLTSCLFAFASINTSATPLIGIYLSGNTTVSGLYTTFGADAVISDNVSASTYITIGANTEGADLSANTITLGAAAVLADLYVTTLTVGAGATNTGIYPETTNNQSALAEIDEAQIALFALETDFAMPVTTLGGTFVPGVYRAPALTTAANSIITLDGEGAENPLWVFNLDTYLVTGAETEIKIINAGAGASVVWNAGQYISLGALTSFVGTAFSGQYVSGGAAASLTCGNFFAKQYISGSAGAEFTSTNCIGSDSWAGSIEGLSAGIDISDGVVLNNPAEPEPEVEEVNIPALPTMALLALFFSLIMARSYKKA